MSKHTPCTHSIEEICDLLETSLGVEEGSKACRELREHIKDCPTCCAELDTLKKTVKVFQEIPEREVPPDVSYRLMTTLKFKVPGVDQNSNE